MFQTFANGSAHMACNSLNFWTIVCSSLGLVDFSLLFAIFDVFFFYEFHFSDNVKVGVVLMSMDADISRLNRIEKFVMKFEMISNLIYA